MKEFTTPDLEPVRFTIDGDPFEATPNPPGNSLMGMASLGSSNDKDDKDDSKSGAATLKIVNDFFATVLSEQSLLLWNTRMGDPARPITFAMAIDVFTWLVETYTGRPTELPSGSPDGQPQVGASSTEPALSGV